MRCSASPVSEGTVRLAGGTSGTDGRVEVLLDGLWGSVCSPNWGASEAVVVCSSFGFEGAAQPVTHWGAGAGYIWCACCGVRPQPGSGRLADVVL